MGSLCSKTDGERQNNTYELNESKSSHNSDDTIIDFIIDHYKQSLIKSHTTNNSPLIFQFPIDIHYP